MSGSPLYIQKRVGFNLKTFNLIKFRSMKIGTVSTSTHLVNTSNSDIDILFRRVILDSSGVFYDQFCDNNLCFPCSGLDWTAPS